MINNQRMQNTINYNSNQISVRKKNMKNNRINMFKNIVN